MNDSFNELSEKCIVFEREIENYKSVVETEKTKQKLIQEENELLKSKINLSQCEFDRKQQEIESLKRKFVEEKEKIEKDFLNEVSSK